MEGDGLKTNAIDILPQEKGCVDFNNGKTWKVEKL